MFLFQSFRMNAWIQEQWKHCQVCFHFAGCIFKLECFAFSILLLVCGTVLGLARVLLLALYKNYSNFSQMLSFFVSLVTIKLKSREVTVKGPRGTLVRNFKHLNLELTLLGKRKLRVDVWFAKRKELACVKTICSHIENMIKGVIYVSRTEVTHSDKCTYEYFSGRHLRYHDIIKATAKVKFLHVIAQQLKQSWVTQLETIWLLFPSLMGPIHLGI